MSSLKTCAIWLGAHIFNGLQWALNRTGPVLPWVMTKWAQYRSWWLSRRGK